MPADRSFTFAEYNFKKNAICDIRKERLKNHENFQRKNLKTLKPYELNQEFN